MNAPCTSYPEEHVIHQSTDDGELINSGFMSFLDTLAHLIPQKVEDHEKGVWATNTMAFQGFGSTEEAAIADLAYAVLEEYLRHQSGMAMFDIRHKVIAIWEQGSASLRQHKHEERYRARICGSIQVEFDVSKEELEDAARRVADTIEAFTECQGFGPLGAHTEEGKLYVTYRGTGHTLKAACQEVYEELFQEIARVPVMWPRRMWWRNKPEIELTSPEGAPKFEVRCRLYIEEPAEEELPTEFPPFFQAEKQVEAAAIKLENPSLEELGEEVKRKWAAGFDPASGGGGGAAGLPLPGDPSFEPTMGGGGVFGHNPRGDDDE